MDNSYPSRILLVEADKNSAKLMAHFLMLHHFNVETVPRGDGALSALLNFNPEIVLLDIVTSEYSDLQLCKKIRSTSDASIIITTANGDNLDHISELEAGADDYVIKPIKPAALLARLLALQRRAARLKKS